MIVEPLIEYAVVGSCTTPSNTITVFAAAGVTSSKPTCKVKLTSEPLKSPLISSISKNSPVFFGYIPIYAIIILYLI